VLLTTSVINTGIITDVVSSTGYKTSTYARLGVLDQVLYMRELVVNGSSALEAIDTLSWLDDMGARYCGASEIAEFGDGAQVFRMTAAGDELCNWYDYDG